MSVPARLRSITDFKLLNDSKDFLAYLCRINVEPKILPKKHKVPLGDKMITLMEDFIELVSSGNRIHVNYKSDYRRRREFQDKASAKLDLLLCIAIVLDATTKLHDSTRNILFNYIYSIGDTLTGWIVSDENRYARLK